MDLLYLFISVFEISIEQIETLEWPVHFFIGFGVIIMCGTLLNVVKEVLMHVGFGKVPRFQLWKVLFIFLQGITMTYLRSHDSLVYITALLTWTRELYVWSSVRPAARVASVWMVSDAYILSSRQLRMSCRRRNPSGLFSCDKTLYPPQITIQR